MSDEPLAHANTPAPISETLPPSEAEYDAICAAVMETNRGRWFLSEYARRNRQADTQVVLSAIERLESVIRSEPATQSIDRVRFDLIEMAKAIARTKAEIAAIKPDTEHHGKIGVATEELDSIVRVTERATSAILAASEQIQEIAWTMREQGIEVQFCDQLDARATDIYTSCSFQDLTGQRIHKVIEAMRFLENRINAMIEIWGADADAASPAEPSTSEDAQDHGLDQADIDTVMGPTLATTAVDHHVIDSEDAGAAQAHVSDNWPPAPSHSPYFGESDLLAAQFDSPAPETKHELPTTPDDAQPAFDVTPMPDAPLPTRSEAKADTLRREARSAASPVRPVSASSGGANPLAAIEALSEEEKIALFS